jgi:RNA polymerase sigma-70 factor, ECF subfamily
MEQIDCLHVHELSGLDGEMHVPGPFDSAASLALDASSPGHRSRLCPEVHERDDGQPFAAHRARLLGIAHRMLGSRAEAEDVVQDVYLRWHQSVRGDVKSPIAFLVTITTRLCLDRLRELKRQHTEHPDPWTFDYVIEDHMPSPEMQLEFSEEVSMAFIAVLERLGPEERAAFLMHDVLDYDYGEIGRMLGKTEAACRQVIHRARERLRGSRARFALTRASCEGVVKKFLAAIGAGDREAVMALLAEELECMAVWINTHVLFDRHDGSLEGRSA